MAQRDDPHGDEQDAKRQIVLKCQPEQILGEIAAQLDGAADHHADAQRPADPRHAPLRHDEQHHAQHTAIYPVFTAHRGPVALTLRINSISFRAAAPLFS